MVLLGQLLNINYINYTSSSIVYSFLQLAMFADRCSVTPFGNIYIRHELALLRQYPTLLQRHHIHQTRKWKPSSQFESSTHNPNNPSPSTVIQSRKIDRRSDPPEPPTNPPNYIITYIPLPPLHTYIHTYIRIHIQQNELASNPILPQFSSALPIRPAHPQSTHQRECLCRIIPTWYFPSRKTIYIHAYIKHVHTNKNKT